MGDWGEGTLSPLPSLPFLLSLFLAPLSPPRFTPATHSSFQTFSNLFPILSFTSYQNNPVPKASEFKVDSFQFDDFSLEPDQMLKASLRMFIDCGFIHEFHIDYEVIKVSPS